MNPTVVLTRAPVTRGERITALDTLRGFALLGILLMNIVAMGMFGAAYDDPTVAGGSTGVNLWIWAILHVVAEGKMRAIFSLVFGAGIILLTSRLESTGRSSADIYYRRNLWQLLFGIPHAYLLWNGEILYPYALCALALFPFRKMSVRGLLTVGGIALPATAGLAIRSGFQTLSMLTDGRAAIAAADQGQKLTDEQQDARYEYEQWQRFNRPALEQVNKNNDEWRGNFFKVVAARAKGAIFWHSPAYYSWGNADIWSMMLIGWD